MNTLIFKKLLFPAILISVIVIALLVTGCNKDNFEDTIEFNGKTYESVESLKNATGIIGFDEANSEFTINIHREGTIDGVITVYPCQLSDEFKVIALQVIVDGNLFIDEGLPEPSLGGQEIFRMDIKTISVID